MADRTLVFIVNGRDVSIRAFDHELLVTVKQCALEQSCNTGRVPRDWELRDMQGQLIDESARVDAFSDSTFFYLSLGVGSGGSAFSDPMIGASEPFGHEPDETAKLRARIEVLEAALRPFAKEFHGRQRGADSEGCMRSPARPTPPCIYCGALVIGGEMPAICDKCYARDLKVQRVVKALLALFIGAVFLWAARVWWGR